MLSIKKIRGWFKFKPEPPVSVTPVPESTRVGRPPAEASTAAPASAETPAADGTEAPRPRRRRRRRRTPSPTGLPLYSEGPHDDEMSLFKAQSNNESRADLRDLTEGLPYGSPDNLASDSASSLVRPSFDASSDAHYGRSRSASDARSLAPSITTSLYLSHTPPRPSSGLYSEEGTPEGSNTPARPSGHRASNSSPGLAPVAPPPPGRARSSTLRSILTRNGSSTLLSSSPGSNSRSPYGQGYGSSSTSRLASSSSASISSQSISAPLQHTLVSSSFIFPKSGPTGAQIAFISSRESLGAYGYGAGALPPSFDDGDADLPSPPLLTTGASMTVPILGRGRRASSVSSQMSHRSSPLARRSPPPASPVVDEATTVETESETPLDDYSPPPTPPSTSPSPPLLECAPISTTSPPTLPALSVIIPSHTLDASSTASSPSTPVHPTARPASPARSDALPSGASTPKHAELSTAVPPLLPSLFLSAATPIHSTATSPVVPGEDRFTASSRRALNFSTISEASFMTDASFTTARDGSE